MPVDLFLPYSATTNPENIGRLLKTIAQQRLVEKLSGYTMPYQRWLFTDRADRLPEDALSFFDGGIVECDPFLRSAGKPPRFSHSMLRNEAIRCARTLAPEWMMFCDGDTVIEPTRMPTPSGSFAIPNVYYQGSAEEQAYDSLKMLYASPEPPYADGNSWFILNRELLYTFVLNEDFAGYGWEDNEFEFRVSGSGNRLSVVDWKVVHVHHTQAERRIDEEVMEKNRALAYTVRWFIQQGSIDPTKPMPHMEVVEAEHPAWHKSKLVMCPALGRVAHVNHESFATYERNGDYVRIQWPGWKADIFRIDGESLVEISLHQQRLRAAT